MAFKSPAEEVVTVKAKFTFIETEIARLQAQVMTLKKTRNGLTPLCRLPVEILGRIFVQTQAPAQRKPFTYGRDPKLHDFGCHQDWEIAISICSHVYRVCMTTPELWAYVDLSWPTSKIEVYTARACDLDLTLVWSTTISSDIVVRSEAIDINATIAGACFQRARAADISFEHNNAVERAIITQVQRQLAPRLSILHLEMNDYEDKKDQDMALQVLELYPTLIELSLRYVILLQPLDMRLSLLSRLHIVNMFTDPNLGYVIGFLRHTPCLTELLLEYIYASHHLDLQVDSVLKNSLTLAHLQKLWIGGDHFVVRNLLVALTPHTPLLQDILIQPDFSKPFSPECTSSSDIFSETVNIWRHISNSPLPPAQITWSSSIEDPSPLDDPSHINICTPCDALHSFKFSTIFQDSDMSLYRQYGLKFDAIRISFMNPDDLTSSWTIILDQITRKYAPQTKKLSFLKCSDGVQNLDGWILNQKSQGQIIERVTFTRCEHDSPTHSDYKVLKEFGLVEHVEWDDSGYY
jgi:hypothetical protein